VLRHCVGVVNVDFLVTLLVGDVVVDGLTVFGGCEEEETEAGLTTADDEADDDDLALVDDGLELVDGDVFLASTSRAAMEAVDDGDDADDEAAVDVFLL